MYRRSHAMIGTCVVVIAMSDGDVVVRFTRTPDALNWTKGADGTPERIAVDLRDPASNPIEPRGFADVPSSL